MPGMPAPRRPIAASPSLVVLGALMLGASSGVLSAATVEEERQQRHVEGMDLIPAVKAINRAIRGTDPAKPWAGDLAALTDPSPGTYNGAIRALIATGSRCLPDLGVLADDRNGEIRQRVALVAAGIGNEAQALLLRLSRDRDLAVRRLAVYGLGRCRGDEAFQRLVQLAGDLDSSMRHAAAQSLGAVARVEAIALLAAHGQDSDDLARRAKAEALDRIVQQPAAVPELIRLLEGGIGSGRDEERAALISVAGRTRDPRLAPVLTAQLARPEAWTVLLAIESLATCGDSRCLEALIRIAVGHPSPDLATAAARTLSTLTGYRAGPGQAWTIWWADHAAEVNTRAERDRFLAALHDPRRNATRDELARFTPAELAPLLECSLGAGESRCAAWFPPRAVAALLADDGRRWVEPVRASLDQTSDPATRAELVVLLDRLAGQDQLAVFTALNDELAKLCKREAEAAAKAQFPPPNRGGERLALQLAISRRR